MQNKVSNNRFGLRHVPVIVVLLMFTMACTPYLYDDGYDQYEPVYLSYEELRESVAFLPPEPMTDIGKVYLYAEHLFINSPNRGIHVFDNTDPSEPIDLGFIKIPGNIDIALKSGFLYADSFIDLVVIDLNDADNPRVVKRIEDVFHYDAYQALPHEIYFHEIDSSKGVVIDYNEKGK